VPDERHRSGVHDIQLAPRCNPCMCLLFSDGVRDRLALQKLSILPQGTAAVNQSRPRSARSSSNWRLRRCMHPDKLRAPANQGSPVNQSFDSIVLSQWQRQHFDQRRAAVALIEQRRARTLLARRKKLSMTLSKATIPIRPTSAGSLIPCNGTFAPCI
jgi:hypothetical protein